jgi:hypothetical protein
MDGANSPAPFVADQSSAYLAIDNAAFNLFDNLVGTIWHTEPYISANGYYVNDGTYGGISKLNGEYNINAINSKNVDGVDVRGEWVSLDLGETRLISKYMMDPRVGTFPGDGHPKRWTLCGTVDNSDPVNTEWYTIDQQHLSPDSSHETDNWNGTLAFTLDTPVETRHIAFIVTRIFPKITLDPALFDALYTSFAGLRFE